MTTETRPALRYPGLVDGIDISEAQTISDASAVAAAGFVFATVKASQGTSYADPRALAFLDELRAVGLICNVYTYLQPSQGSPKAQIDKAYAAAGAEFPLRLALDLEAAPASMTPDQLIAFAEACVDECLENGVLEPEVYSFPYFMTSRLQPALARSVKFAACPLYIASYGSNTLPWLPPAGAKPFLCAPWSTWTKWQYSGNGGFKVPGIVGDCDRDLFNGDLAAFRTYMGLDVRVEPEAAIVHPDPLLDMPNPTDRDV